MARLGELVVRGAGDDAAPGCAGWSWSLSAEPSAHGANTSHSIVEDLVERHDRRAELALRALGLERVDVGDGELRARSAASSLQRW